MQQEAFTRLEPSEAGPILEKLNPLFGGSSFNPVSAVILSQPLPFLPGFRLLDIADHSVIPALRRHVVYSKNRHEVLDFTSAPIYKLASEVPADLNDRNVCDYVRFFFAYVRGPRGKFRIVENVDDIPWKDDPPPNARKAIGKMITPVTLNPGRTKSGYDIGVCVVFKDSLFKIRISVDARGVIDMGEESLLVEDLPVLDDTFFQ
jgi:hypothetical protein